MSFTSTLQILAHDPIDLENDKVEILNILSNDGIHADVFADLVEAFEEGEASFNCHAAYLFELIPAIAKIVGKGATFDARGLGEEFADTWVQSFSEGELLNSCAVWDHGFDM